MKITERVQTDLTAATKAGERRRLSALRLLLDALKKASKEARRDLNEHEEIAVLRRERKRRTEAAQAYTDAGRAELAEAEEAEAVIIDGYLPQELSEHELEALVADALGETGAQSTREIGRVMATLMPKVGGRADGRRVSELVREKLD